MKTCRICYEGETDENPLLTPCRCAGSVAHVHADCLRAWRRVKPTAACELCLAPWTQPQPLPVAVRESVGIPCEYLFLRPGLLLVLWIYVHCGFLVLTERTRVYTLYEVALILRAVYSGIPYSLLSITCLYGVIMIRAIRGIRNQSGYRLCIGDIVCRNRYASFTPLISTFLYTAGLLSSFVYPLPGCIFTLSFLSQIPQTHRYIVARLNREDE